DVLIPTVNDAVRLGTVHQLSVTQMMHRAGINMRYLGTVLAKIHHAESAARLLIFIEALARQCKINLRQRIQKSMTRLKVPLTQPYVKTSLKFFNLVFGNRPESEEYHLRLKEQIAVTYAIHLDPSENAMPVRSFLTSCPVLQGPHLLFVRCVSSSSSSSCSLFLFFFNLLIFYLFVSSQKASRSIWSPVFNSRIFQIWIFQCCPLHLFS
ncbi:MAG: hypothetical protein Q8P67_11625, partial [archaeon]|nr:hypothetical protein [archaeon]